MIDFCRDFMQGKFLKKNIGYCFHLRKKKQENHEIMLYFCPGPAIHPIGVFVVISLFWLDFLGDFFCVVFLKFVTVWLYFQP